MTFCAGNNNALSLSGRLKNRVSCCDSAIVAVDIVIVNCWACHVDHLVGRVRMTGLLSDREYFVLMSMVATKLK